MRGSVVLRAAAVLAVAVAVFAWVALVGDRPDGGRVIITNAASFRAVMTVSGTVEGEAIFQQLEVLYDSPDGLQIMPVGQWTERSRYAPRRSEVLIGARGWQRLEPPGTWRALAPFEVGSRRRFSLDALQGLQGFIEQSEELMFLFNFWLLLVTPEGTLTVTEGTEIAGEATVSYRRSDLGFGQRLTTTADDESVVPAETSAAITELYGDVAAEYELLVGAETRHAYRFVATLRGANLDQTFEIVFSDYNEPVTIEPPAP